MIILFSENGNENDINAIIRKHIIRPHEELFISDGKLSMEFIERARIGICSDSNHRALTLLYETRTPVITCGMNGLNTITLSSHTARSCSVTLQRAIKTINGKITDPAEIPIKLTSAHTPFTVMATSAVMLLNGIFPESI